MSKRNWGVVFALVGWLSLTAGQPANSYPVERGASPQSQQSAPKEATATPSNEQENEARRLNEPCEKGDENRGSDLCAQWKAADAADSSAQAAWWLGAFETMIGALTMGAAIFAALYAKQASQAAIDALNHARPFILMGDIHCDKTDRRPDGMIALGKEGQMLFDFNLAWSNFGQTPAAIQSIETKVTLLDRNKPFPTKKTDVAMAPAPTEPRFADFIAPNHAHAEHAIAYQSDVWVEDGTRRFTRPKVALVVSRIYYRSPIVRGKLYTSQFAMIVLFSQEAGIRQVAAQQQLADLCFCD